MSSFAVLFHPSHRRAFRRTPPAACLLLGLLHGQASATEEAPAAPAELDRIVVKGERTTYATGQNASATGLALSPRETPQSISVIGRAQMEDFGLDNLNDALESTTGISVERVESSRTYYTARGFDITNFQRDGLGIPLPYGIQNGDVDTAPYERIEVLRGANGLMSATGNPSATINFVRKRPTNDVEGSARATFGSWNRLRLEGDAGAPLTDAGNVLGRLGAAWEQGGSYLDRNRLDKRVAYGAIDLDLGANTMLSAGASHQRNDADSPLWGALPLYYTDGTPTDYDRGSSTATDWAYWDTTETRAFVELVHAFGRDWELKAAWNFEQSEDDAQLFYAYGTPDRATGLGLFAYPSDYAGDFTARQLDVRAAGPLRIGGREHDVVVGASWTKGRTEELSWYPDGIGTPLPPLEQWTGAYPKPAFDAYSDGSDFDYRRDSLYATVRWNLADTLKLITGANRARVEMRGEGYGEPHDADETRTSPFVGAVWDIGEQYSAYASYAEIFAQQSELDLGGRPVGSILGSNAEVGLKGEWWGGRLNASAAVFRVRQDNLAEYAGFDLATARTYYAGVDAESRGYELDIAGHITTQWSVAGGFTHLQIDDRAGDATRTYVPRNLLRLSTVWDVASVEGLRVGASVRWQDDIAREQSLVLANGLPVVTTQPAHAIVGAMAGYRFGNGWDAAFNLDNLTDEKYIPSLYWEQGYFAAPRSVSLSVGYRF